jgi:hypothetical protein
MFLHRYLDAPGRHYSLDVVRGLLPIIVRLMARWLDCGEF